MKRLLLIFLATAALSALSSLVSSPVQALTMFKITWWGEPNLEIIGGVIEAHTADGMDYQDMPSHIEPGPNLLFSTSINSGWDDPSVEWLLSDFRNEDGQVKHWQVLLWWEQGYHRVNYLLETELTGDGATQIWWKAAGDSGSSYKLLTNEFVYLPPSLAGHRLDIYSFPVPEPASIISLSLLLGVGVTVRRRRWR